MLPVEWAAWRSGAPSAGPALSQPPAWRSEMAVAIESDIVDELVAICGAEHVKTGRAALLNRARVPAPFPVHRWEEHMPSAVVLPTSAEQVSEVVKLANRLADPGRAACRRDRAGRRGGAAARRDHGRRQADEPDQGDRPRRPDGHGRDRDQHAQAQRALRKYGVFYPDDPASYPCSLVGGRIGTNGWSLLGGRFGHTRDLVISIEIVLPTGEIIRGRRRRRAQVPQVVGRLSCSSSCSWATRARSA